MHGAADGFGGQDDPLPPAAWQLRAEAAFETIRQLERANVDEWGNSADLRISRVINARRHLSTMTPPSSTPSEPLPDSGARTEYKTGAVRDASTGKGHFHSIPPVAMRKLAKRFEDGAAKYAQDNYMRGIPLRHYMDSLMRHLLAWHEGDTSEDHAGAILWNAATMIWTDEEVKAGTLPKELDNLPYRKRS